MEDDNTIRVFVSNAPSLPKPFGAASPACVQRRGYRASSRAEPGVIHSRLEIDLWAIDFTLPARRSLGRNRHVGKDSGGDHPSPRSSTRRIFGQPSDARWPQRTALPGRLAAWRPTVLAQDAASDPGRKTIHRHALALPVRTQCFQMRPRSDPANTFERALLTAVDHLTCS
jgi:hypothetical protein